MSTLLIFILAEAVEEAGLKAAPRKKRSSYIQSAPKDKHMSKDDSTVN